MYVFLVKLVVRVRSELDLYFMSYFIAVCDGGSLGNTNHVFVIRIQKRHEERKEWKVCSGLAKGLEYSVVSYSTYLHLQRCAGKLLKSIEGAFWA